MKQAAVWYIDERAEQLAVVYLTRRDDLRILPPLEDDSELDYLVRIRTSDSHSKRVFGVLVKGMLERTSLQHITEDSAVQFTWHSFPVCELLFIMETDEGFFRWLQEPLVTPSGEAVLHHPGETIFHPLTPEALDSMVDQVNQWYDASV